jgi:butyryl-CoA dehydrogenase
MTALPANPLVDDRDVELFLDEVLDLPALLRLPYFAEHDRDTCQLLLESARGLAREVLLPSYRATDADPPRLVDGRVRVHPQMRELYARLNQLGLISAARPHAVGGSQLPLTVYSMASAYLMAGNLSAYGYFGLTQGAAHLLEAFGDDALRSAYMAKLYSGEWTGTMALTEPQAGSSLADVATAAEPAPDGAGYYRITGSKIFISGGDQDITENIVHMALGRIRGAPAGMKGVSLFCIPKRRLESGGLVDNDVAVTGVIHKIGYRALPSVALAFGERGDCRGWLVGEPNQGIRYMFQMMNEARIMVGVNGVATASVAYHESIAYARVRTQGRPVSAKDPAAPPVAITAHADVRRMLLRQKAIVEAGLLLIARVSYYADLSHYAETAAERERAGLLLDLLTPIAKSFPADRGFESNALALQIHGGYGYSSEYLPEAWLRDQKLNSIHEGTSGIQAIDLLGRRAVAQGGAALVALGSEVARTCARARSAGVDAGWIAGVERALGLIGGLTRELAERGLRGGAGGAEAMLAHASDYLELFSTAVVAWQWLELAAVAREALAGRLPRGRASRDAGYYQAKLAAAQYWIRTELPRIDHLAALCRDGEDSYVRLNPDWL